MRGTVNGQIGFRILGLVNIARFWRCSQYLYGPTGFIQSGKESLPATLWRGRFRGIGMGNEEGRVHHYGTSSPGSVVSCSPDSSVASSVCSSCCFSKPSTSASMEPALMDLRISASSSSSGPTTEAPPGVVPAPALGIVKLLILDGRILFIDMP